MKLYRLVAFLLTAAAVFEIVILDIEAEMRSTASVRSRLELVSYQRQAQSVNQMKGE